MTRVPPKLKGSSAEAMWHNQMREVIMSLIPVHSVNNKEWSLGDKNLDHPLDLNVNKPLKIIYNYHWYEYDESTKKLESFNEDLYGRAKNNTIGEVWKGIDRLYIKHGLIGTDHKFIEDIDIEGNVLKFSTGS